MLSESRDKIWALYLRASSIERAVLPEAVGPKIAMVFNDFLLHVSLSTDLDFGVFRGTM